MGARLTAFENRADVDMEIRVFVPPDRPDRYRMIVRVKPGEIKKVLTKRLCKWEEYFSSEYVNHQDDDNHVFLMVFMDGIYTGVTLLPWEVKKYAKIIGYYEGDSGVTLKGVRCTFTSFFRLKMLLVLWIWVVGSGFHVCGSSFRVFGFAYFLVLVSCKLLKLLVNKSSSCCSLV